VNKTEHSRLICRKLAANREVLNVVKQSVQFNYSPQQTLNAWGKLRLEFFAISAGQLKLSKFAKRCAGTAGAFLK